MPSNLSNLRVVARRCKSSRIHFANAWAYYLLSGELEMWAGDQLVKKIVGGEANAFQPLAQLQPRQMSATALSAAQVLRVDRNLLDKLLSAGHDEAPPAAFI